MPPASLINIARRAGAAAAACALALTASAGGAVEPADRRSLYYGVHLASYKSKGNVTTGWTKLSTQYKSVLAHSQPRVERVRVNGAEFYRLKAGPFASEAAAQAACAAIEGQGDFCRTSTFFGIALSELTG